MTTTAQSIVKDVQVNNLTDATGTRFTATLLVECLNWAQRVIAATRWDSTAAAVAVTLAAGVRQTLPAAYQGLIDFTHVGNITTGEAVRQVAREDLDAILPAWRSAAQTAAVTDFIYDKREPRAFMVSPPAIVGTLLHGIASAYPTDVPAPTAPGAVYTTVTGNIGLPDEFAPALVALTTYRAYMKDVEYAANAALAAQHLQAAVTMVGEQLRIMVEASPSTQKDSSR